MEDDIRICTDKECRMKILCLHYYIYIDFDELPADKLKDHDFKRPPNATRCDEFLDMRVPVTPDDRFYEYATGEVHE